MPAMILLFATEFVVLNIVGAASAANMGWFYSRLKPLPQVVVFRYFSRAWPAPTEVVSHRFCSFPHEQNTQWLKCANQCGICHGNVAFPVTDGRRCHSKAKPIEITAGKIVLKATITIMVD